MNIISGQIIGRKGHRATIGILCKIVHALAILMTMTFAEGMNMIIIGSTFWLQFMMFSAESTTIKSGVPVVVDNKDVAIGYAFFDSGSELMVIIGMNIIAKLCPDETVSQIDTALLFLLCMTVFAIIIGIVIYVLQRKNGNCLNENKKQ